MPKNPHINMKTKRVIPAALSPAVAPLFSKEGLLEGDIIFILFIHYLKKNKIDFYFSQVFSYKTVGKNENRSFWT
jgi:hypothetical protein